MKYCLWERLEQMHRMSVWDNHGRQYMPIYNSNGRIYCYARAKQAMTKVIHNYNLDINKARKKLGLREF